uniref:E4 n=1 Tax=Human papillomavirus 59 TaxID=37115 RepID=B9UPE3_HPV59|nr:E4 [human papillomavirus 59]AGU90653.1 E4 [human papillomavirus 59]AGU90661.1 E4 [human papillomavirus 59]AGU90677.1 E4 [human papillomavirus 59]AGU90685.1 E4 [human papillomavirus 59]
MMPKNMGLQTSGKCIIMARLLIVMTLCAVPVTSKYPLLDLLSNYHTPPQRPPKPRTWAPKRPTVRRRLESDQDSVDTHSTLSLPACQWTTVTTQSSVCIQATTRDGTSLAVTLRL